MYQQRIDRVLAEMEQMGLTQMIVSDPRSIWYLSGIDNEPYERLYAMYLRRGETPGQTEHTVDGDLEARIPLLGRRIEAMVSEQIGTVVRVEEQVAQEWLAEQMRTHVIDWVIAAAGLEKYITKELTILVNPSGSFVLGGPMGDAGLTGRKIIVDTYGGMARHGGGAFSGKDPSKVDRSAAYAMRWVAKNIVAAGLAERAEVQIAYAIGRAQPVGLYVETFGTAAEGLNDGTIQQAVSQVFDLRPAAIIRELDLLRPIYADTAAYGHFGRTDIDFPWESIAKADELRSAAGL